MATPAAIGVYSSGAGVPDHVNDRPWRGVYHHHDGDLSGLGAYLVNLPSTREGDLHRIVYELVDEAPWGWSNCFKGSAGKYPSDDAGSPVGPNDVNAVAFVYVFDIDARRLDAFETTADSGGRRVGSVTFSRSGEPAPRAFDLSPDECVDEAPLVGRPLTADQLDTMVSSLRPIKSGAMTVSWGDAHEAADGSLVVRFFVIGWKDGQVNDVAESEWPLAPKVARSEPERVRNLLEAFVEVMAEGPVRPDVVRLYSWIRSLDPLRRSGARTKASLAAILRAHARAR
ncbi:MAG: hypothetical protein AB7O24_02930 [Kofleriaceae bacterium]